MAVLSDELILAREAELQRIRDEAIAELQELATVKRYMARLAQRPEAEGAGMNGSAIPEPPPAKTPQPQQATLSDSLFGGARPKGLTEAIKLALQRSERPWMTAKELRFATSELLGRDVPMSSVSPKLTDLKNKRDIVRDDMKVALANRVEGQV